MTNKDEHYIVPATPGWFVAIYVEGGKDYEEYLRLEPIIAWETQREERTVSDSRMGHLGDHCLNHDVMPLTIDGNMNWRNSWAIKRPDGSYYTVDGGFTIEAELIAELRGRKAEAAK
jgi:hypothetical protein